jgi:hypothetical protein
MTEVFSWDCPGLNWAQFHSLANLLSLRNGGQVEPTAKFDTEPELYSENHHEEHEDPISLDTVLADRISDSGHGRLKKRFLDAVAGFAANKKGGTAVACSAMKEAEDDVVIWLARNDGFSNYHQPGFEKLAKILGSLSSKASKYCSTARLTCVLIEARACSPGVQEPFMGTYGPES